MCIGLGTKGRRGALAAAVVSVVAGLASVAGGQSLRFEPPLYRGSAEGVPLAGQDGWYVPGAGASEWRVYHNGGSELGLDPLPAGDENVVGVALDAPLGLPEVIEHTADIPPILVIQIHVAVDFDPSLAPGEEIGRMTLEPERASASFGWIARRDAGGDEAWTLELISYTAESERVQEVIFKDLAPGVWHELRIYAVPALNELEFIEFVDTRTWRDGHVRPAAKYLAGGAAGGLPFPTALRLTAAARESTSAQVAIGLDNLWIAEREPCYQDCDRSGPWDFFDFLCFQSRFAGGDPYADCDGSGTLDFFDFLCFQDLFASAGCGP